MDEHDEKALDYLTMVPVEYWFDGHLLVSVYSWVYPNYNPGEPIRFDVKPSNRDRMRRPAQEFTRGFLVIEKILHVVAEPQPGVFTTKLEVLLKEPPDDQQIDDFPHKIDKSSNQPSIPSRLLRRPK